jgi:aminoglycoside 2'-N-acetyltransferase I
VLSTGEHGFYERLGWERWYGESWVKTPTGLQRTFDDDDSLMILRTRDSPPLDTRGTIVADWRSGDVW